MVIVRTRRQGYERFLNSCKGAIYVVTGGKRSKQKKSLQRYLHSLQCTLPRKIFCSGSKDLFKIRKNNIATNRVNYLQSISFSK